MSSTKDTETEQNGIVAPSKSVQDLKPVSRRKSTKTPVCIDIEAAEEEALRRVERAKQLVPPDLAKTIEVYRKTKEQLRQEAENPSGLPSRKRIAVKTRKALAATHNTRRKPKIDTYFLTEFQEMYCYYRALGFSRMESAKKAGSTASDKSKLYNVGEQLENNPRSSDKIRTRIAYYKDQFVQAAAVRVEEVAALYQEILARAFDKGDLKIARDVVKDLSELTGLSKNDLRTAKQKPYKVVEAGMGLIGHDDAGLEDLLLSGDAGEEIKRLMDISKG